MAMPPQPPVAPNVRQPNSAAADTKAPTPDNQPIKPQPPAAGKAGTNPPAKPTANDPAPVKAKRATTRKAPTTRKRAPAKTSGKKPAVKAKSTIAAPPADDADKGKGRRTGWKIAGGVGALGAATAALFMLRGSTPRKKAHQPDGTDSSKSFAANIADENTVPDKA